MLVQLRMGKAAALKEYPQQSREFLFVTHPILKG